MCTFTSLSNHWFSGLFNFAKVAKIFSFHLTTRPVIPQPWFSHSGIFCYSVYYNMDNSYLSWRVFVFWSPAGSCCCRSLSHEESTRPDVRSSAQVFCSWPKLWDQGTFHSSNGFSIALKNTLKSLCGTFQVICCSVTKTTNCLKGNCSLLL